MSRDSTREAIDAETAMRDVQARHEGNGYCADCGVPRPEYVNLTLGTFICNGCADVHRSISNRRIKDMYARDLTMDNVRRMDAVGNEVANRKFLATWNPREVPEPKPGDKDALREFIWLKYEGSFKRTAAAPPPPPQSRAHEYQDRGYYSGRGTAGVAADRGGGYGRERDLFRDQPLPPANPSASRSSYWAERFEPPQQQLAPPPSMRPSQSEDYYRTGRGPSPGPARPDRYNPSVDGRPDRFRPPSQPSSFVPYGRPPPGMRSRYDDNNSIDEDYGSINGDMRRDGGRSISSSGRRKPTSRRTSKLSSRTESYSDGDGEVVEERSSRKTKEGKKKSSTSRRKKQESEEDDNSNESSEGSGSESEESEERRRAAAKKAKKKKQAAIRKKSSRQNGRDNSEDADSDEDGSSESYDKREEKSKQKSSRKGEKRGSKATKGASNPFVDDDDASDEAGSRASRHSRGQLPSKAEFDLMSEWMGAAEAEAANGHASNSATGAGAAPSPGGGLQPGVIPQAYQTAQMPMMAPPMSVYPGMMGGNPGFMGGPGGYMPMMPPGYMPSVHGMNMMMPPPGQLGMMNMMGVPPPPSPQQQAHPPMQMMHPGLVAGMQNMGLQQPMHSLPPGAGPLPAGPGPMPQGVGPIGASPLGGGSAGTVPPPPPPPAGQPAGPPPGPPE